MQPIVEYLDYRKYILDFYTERKALYGFTWRKFAQLAGFSNPVYLKQVCDGKFNLSSSATERVGKAMELSGSDQTYFRLLVVFSHAKADSIRQTAFLKLQDIAEQRKSAVLNSDTFEFFKSWKYSVIRELASNMPGAKPAEIGRMCEPEIPASDVSDALLLMVNLGVLVQDKKGNFHQTSKVISMMDGAKSVASSRLQKDMGLLALDAIGNVPFEERSMSGLTMGISEKSYDRVVKAIADFRRKVSSIICDDKTEQVYRLNLHFFPLSKKIKK